MLPNYAWAYPKLCNKQVGTAKDIAPLNLFFTISANVRLKV